MRAVGTRHFVLPAVFRKDGYRTVGINSSENDVSRSGEHLEFRVSRNGSAAAFFHVHQIVLP
jgi:hypothetical protein